MCMLRARIFALLEGNIHEFSSRYSLPLKTFFHMRIVLKVFFQRSWFVERFGLRVAEDFYPFVENGQAPAENPLEPRHPARIAVYDDAAAAPRVVEVAPKDVRAYLEEITLQVTQLAQAQGGMIPFMVIREIVENLIHAYFIEPTVSILDHGNTIRFSDQGPGIRQKDRALQYGTTSATEEMRRYIRGVGSGLPYVQQYMADKGGSLLIEDNMAGGTVVTISASAGPQASAASLSPTQTQQPPWPSYQQNSPQTPQQGWQQAPQGWPQQQPPQGWQQQPYPAQQGWQQPQQGWPQQPYQQQGWPPQSWQAPYVAQAPAQAPPWGAAAPGDESGTSGGGFPWVSISSRGEAILQYLRTHDSVGPSDLARALGGSQPTWTRELQALEDQGLVRKDGQKRRLTSMGQAYLQR